MENKVGIIMAGNIGTRLKPLTEQANGLVDKLEGSQLLKTMAQNKGKFQRASEQLSSLKNLA